MFKKELKICTKNGKELVYDNVSEFGFSYRYFFIQSICAEDDARMVDTENVLSIRREFIDKVYRKTGTGWKEVFLKTGGKKRV